MRIDLSSGGWNPPAKLIRDEYFQQKLEGVVFTPEFAAEIEKIANSRFDWDEATLAPLADELATAKNPTDYAERHPDDLEAIRAARPKGALLQRRPAPADAELLDRLHGAWLGRSIGCALGKPVETMGMGGKQRHDIRTYLEERGDWPLTDYFSNRPVAGGSGLSILCPLSQRENIRFMESDDDIRYTLIGLLLLEGCGRNFTWRDVAELWSQQLPMSLLCTAERQAMMNYCRQTGRTWDDGTPWHLDYSYATIESIRTQNNPFREWIGAQIRADFFGFINPGDPDTAAEYAWRDASWTHVRNGIYGEMLFAAVQAAAFTESDPRKLLEIGLAAIPVESELARALRELLVKYPEFTDVDSFMEWVEARYPGMSAVHTINNALICAAALLLGKGDFDRSVCFAVACGLDTDCNGATVGAIIGILRGADNLNSSLSARLNNTIRAEFGEFREVKITDLAARTLKLYHALA